MINKYKLSISVLIGLFFAILIAVSYFFVKYQLNIAIQNSTEAGNAVLTRVFVNETWSEISPLLPEPRADLETIKSNPNIKDIDSKIRRFISYTDVMKVKLYNVKGITVYSSETPQIGEDKSKNKGFQEAVRGNLASELIYRGHFGSFDKEIYNRNLVATYAPIRDGYQVVAVAEIYSDRTASIKITNKLLNKFLLFLSFTCLFLYLIIIYIFSKNKNKNKNIINNNSNPNSIIDEGFSPTEIVDLSDRNIKILSKPYHEMINRLVHAIDVGSKYQSTGKLDSRLFLSEITELSSNISSRLEFNNLILSLENKSYVHNPQVFNLGLFLKNLESYVAEESNLDKSKIHFYQNIGESTNLYQDESLLNHLYRAIFEFLSDRKFKGNVQIKTFSADSVVEIMTVVDFGNTVPSDFHDLSDSFTNVSSYLNKSAGMILDVRLSEHSAFIDLKFQSMVAPLSIARQFKKIGLLFDKELDVSLFKLMLDEISIQFVVINKSYRLEQAIKNDNIDFLMIDSGYLNRNPDLYDQLSSVINSGLLTKDQLLLVQPSYGEFENILDLPFITLPFSPASLYQKLNVLRS